MSYLVDVYLTVSIIGYCVELLRKYLPSNAGLNFDNSSKTLDVTSLCDKSPDLSLQRYDGVSQSQKLFPDDHRSNVRLDFDARFSLQPVLAPFDVAPPVLLDGRGCKVDLPFPLIQHRPKNYFKVRSWVLWVQRGSE